MGFLKKLFGGGDGGAPSSSDKDGFFVYVQCDRCQAPVRLRINRQHDLNYSDDGYVWRKTIVDSRCFQQIPTVVHFDRSLNVISQEIEGGHFISQSEYEQAEVSSSTDSGTSSE
jgi:hypothetical protein